MNPVATTKSDVKGIFKHPIALLVFGMLFAAFLFPLIGGWLYNLKAGGNATLANLIPSQFTTPPATGS